MRDTLSREELNTVKIWRLVAAISEAIEEIMKIRTTPKQWYQIFDFISDLCSE